MECFTGIDRFVARAVSPCWLLIMIPPALGWTLAPGVTPMQGASRDVGKPPAPGVSRGSDAPRANATGVPARRPGFGGRRGPRGMEGRGPEGRERPPLALWQRMNQEERTHVEQFIEEHFPRMFLELRRVEENHPEQFERRMSRIAPQMRHLMEILEIHPERGALMIQERQLDVRIMQFVRRFRSSADKRKRPELREKIRKLCAEAFDCRHERRALEIRELEARVAELRARNTQAAQMRKQLIEQEVKKRLGRPGGRPSKRD